MNNERKKNKDEKWAKKWQKCKLPDPFIWPFGPYGPYPLFGTHNQERYFVIPKHFLSRQQEREQAELQRIAEKRRKEKIADAEARARVKKQIEEDRRARNAKYDEKHEAEMKAKQAELDEIKGINKETLLVFAFSGHKNL